MTRETRKAPPGAGEPAREGRKGGPLPDPPYPGPPEREGAVSEGKELVPLLPEDLFGPTEVGRRAVTRYTASLMDRLHLTLSALRKERGERLGDLDLGRTDVAPLVRSLAGFADTIDYASKALKDVAKEAREQIGEEVRSTGTRRVVVPDGFGKEVVAKITTPRTRRVDHLALLQALTAIRTTTYERYMAAEEEVSEQERHQAEDLYRLAYRQAQEDILSVTSSISPSVSKIDALSRTMQAHGQDDLAGLLDRTMEWVEGEEKTEVTVEDPKRVRRA